MLTHIQINNFAIVKELDLDIPGQLTVITGETGAGKSIMIDALSLTLGARAESGAVRAGAEKADILATFDISQNLAAKIWLEKHDLNAEDECIMRRIVSSDGRSRGYINGTPSPIQALKELGTMLVSIHGQHEHQALLKRDTHRALLDNFADQIDLSNKVAELYKYWQRCLTEYENFRDHSKELSDRADLLRFQIAELDELKPETGELESLELEHKRLSNVDSLALLGQQALDGLIENESSLSNQCRSLLQSIQRLVSSDESTQEIAALVESAQIQLDEAGNMLSRYLDHLEMDPERYEQVDNRLSTYFNLSRKHRCDSHALAELWQHLQGELAAIDGGDDRLEELAKMADQAKNLYLETASNLSQQRQQAIKKLNKLITLKIQPLGMPGAEFHGQLIPLGHEQYSQYGLESVEFHVITNPGQPAKPLNKVASGGELSRISLAIQVACAVKSQVSTMIFDEVDVGIGGAVAQVVGELLRELGSHNQVLCVTHLPQVAAKGHHHLHVDKKTNKNNTLTTVNPLNDKAKETEIARMLGGIDITEQSLAHAKELIEVSQS